jgi:hypothetical protein
VASAVEFNGLVDELVQQWRRLSFFLMHQPHRRSPFSSSLRSSDLQSLAQCAAIVGVIADLTVDRAADSLVRGTLLLSTRATGQPFGAESKAP